MSLRGAGNPRDGKRPPPFVVRFGHWQASLPLTAAQHVVALTLGVHASAEGRAHPGVETLARETGLAKRSVYTALAALVDAGVIRVRAPGGGRTRTTEYQLLIGATGSPNDPETVTWAGGNGDITAAETVQQGPPKRVLEEVDGEDVRGEVPHEAMRMTRAALLAQGILKPSRAGDEDLLRQG